MTQCYRCGRIADAVAKTDEYGLLCRFCQAEMDGRCLLCGSPGDPWPPLEPRYTHTPSMRCPNCDGKLARGPDDERPA